MRVMWEEVSHELQIRAFTPLRGDLRALRIRAGNRRTAEPVLRGLDDASGQREHGPRLGVQSRWHCGDEIRRRATAELEQSDVSEPVRRCVLPGVAALGALFLADANHNAHTDTYCNVDPFALAARAELR